MIMIMINHNNNNSDNNNRLHTSAKAFSVMLECRKTVTNFPSSCWKENR